MDDHAPVAEIDVEAPAEPVHAPILPPIPDDPAERARLCMQVMQSVLGQFRCHVIQGIEPSQVSGGRLLLEPQWGVAPNVEDQQP